MNQTCGEKGKTKNKDIGAVDSFGEKEYLKRQACIILVASTSLIVRRVTKKAKKRLFRLLLQASRVRGKSEYLSELEAELRFNCRQKVVPAILQDFQCMFEQRYEKHLTHRTL